MKVPLWRERTILERTGFTKEELDAVQMTAVQLSGDLIYDMLEGGCGTIKRAEIMEVVLDAGRLEQELKRAYGRKGTDPVHVSAAEKLRGLSYELALAAIRPVFDAERYFV